jgi:hypothetical protein
MPYTFGRDKPGAPVHGTGPESARQDIARKADVSGPQALAGMPFYFGLNDPVAGDYRSGRAFDRARF